MVKSSELQKYLPRKTEHSYHQSFFWHRLKKYVNALCLHSSGQDNSTRDWHARNASETRIRGSRFSHVASRWFCSCQPLRLSPIVASLKFFSSLFLSVEKRKSKTLRQFCALVRNVQTLQVLTQFRLRDWNWNVKTSTNFCLLFRTLVFCINTSALRLIEFTWKLAFFLFHSFRIWRS